MNNLRYIKEITSIIFIHLRNQRLGLILLFLICIGFLLRVRGLDTYPFNFDESLHAFRSKYVFQLAEAHPLREKLGVGIPVYSGQDHAPLFYYLSHPFIRFLGSTVYSARLAAVIMGILSILAVFFLASEVFDDLKVGVVSAFLVTFNPL